MMNFLINQLQILSYKNKVQNSIYELNFCRFELKALISKELLHKINLVYQQEINALNYSSS